MKYTIWLAFPSQGTRLWDCAHYAVPHKCWTGLSPFAAFLSKKHTLAAPLVTHQDITMQNNEVSLLDMSSSFFIRHYLKNPLSFCFHHLLICLNSEGTFSKSGLIEGIIPWDTITKTQPTIPTRFRETNCGQSGFACITNSHEVEPQLVFDTPTCDNTSERASTADQRMARKVEEGINTGKTANWG